MRSEWAIDFLSKIRLATIIPPSLFDAIRRNDELISVETAVVLENSRAIRKRLNEISDISQRAQLGLLPEA